jgi:hypothetical protein
MIPIVSGGSVIFRWFRDLQVVQLLLVVQIAEGDSGTFRWFRNINVIQAASESSGMD